MKHVFALLIGTMVSHMVCAVGVAQAKPAAPAADPRAAEPPSFELVLTHAGECSHRTPNGVCQSMAHWQVEVTMPGVAEPAVVPLVPREDLLRVLRDAKKELEEVGPTGMTFFKNPVVIRSPSWAPFRAVQRVIETAGHVGLYKMDVVASALDAEASANENAPAPAEEDAAPEPVIDDALRSKLEGPDPVRIAVFCDPASGTCLRKIGSIAFPCSANGDRQLCAVLRAAASARPRGTPLHVEVDGVAVAPWGRIVELTTLCRKLDMHVDFLPYPGRPLPTPQGAESKKAFITGDGWRVMRLADFVNVNGDADTWTEKDGVIVGTGKPLGGARSKQQFTNFELVLEWKHREVGGNSGVFVWCPESAFTDLPRGKLPRSGIEVQVLDPGYEEQWLQQKGKRSDWFTGHGDVFPVGDATMQPFTPQIAYELPGGELVTVGSDKSSRCFPTKRLIKPKGEWNHYYIRAINGEVRLWVNGEEVSGGTRCKPASGYLALEAEGALIEFRNLRLRELP